jgi:hypothetical protein
MATRHAAGGYNCGFTCPKTLPLRSPQAIDSQVPVAANSAVQNQMFSGNPGEGNRDPKLVGETMIRMGVIGYGYWGPYIARNLRALIQ